MAGIRIRRPSQLNEPPHLATGGFFFIGLFRHVFPAPHGAAQVFAPQGRHSVNQTKIISVQGHFLKNPLILQSRQCKMPPLQMHNGYKGISKGCSKDDLVPALHVLHAPPLS